jgi:putative transposase
VRDHQNAALSAAIMAIVQVRRRFGYRRIHNLLQLEFPNMNHKRMYWVYSVVNLAVH